MEAQIQAALLKWGTDYKGIDAALLEVLAMLAEQQSWDARQLATTFGKFKGRTRCRLAGQTAAGCSLLP